MFPSPLTSINLRFSFDEYKGNVIGLSQPPFPFDRYILEGGVK